MAVIAALTVSRLNGGGTIFDLLKPSVKKQPAKKPHGFLFPYYHTCGKEYVMREVLFELERCDRCGGEFDGIRTKAKRGDTVMPTAEPPPKEVTTPNVLKRIVQKLKGYESVHSKTN